ncbi:MAG: signal peptidase I [Pyrinomonadaceae bacterium]
MRVKPLVLAFFILISSGCSTVKKIAVQPVKVEGIAMEPALTDGDRIFIDRGYDRIGRDDIVIFYYPADQSKSFIKRVVGLPNDRIEIRKALF